MRVLYLFAVIALMLWPPLPAGAAELSPIRLVFDTNENPPFTRGVGTAIDPEKPGIIIELLRRAAEKARLPIMINRVPWQRGLYLLQNDGADGIFMSSFKPERLEYGVYPQKNGVLDPTRKLTDLAYWLYVRRGSDVGFDGTAIHNLKAPVGATTGYAVVSILRDMGVAVEEEPSHQGNLQKLLAGRIDGYAELQGQADAVIAANPGAYHDVIRLAPPLRKTAYYLMIAKSFYARNTVASEAYWDAIAAINADPGFQEMVRVKYAD